MGFAKGFVDLSGGVLFCEVRIRLDPIGRQPHVCMPFAWHSILGDCVHRRASGGMPSKFSFKNNTYVVDIVVECAFCQVLLGRMKSLFKTHLGHPAPEFKGIYNARYAAAVAAAKSQAEDPSGAGEDLPPTPTPKTKPKPGPKPGTKA